MKSITVTEQEMLAKAQGQQYEEPVTAFLFDVNIIKRGRTATATGNVYSHVKANPETGFLLMGMPSIPRISPAYLAKMATGSFRRATAATLR